MIRKIYDFFRGTPEERKKPFSWKKMLAVAVITAASGFGIEYNVMGYGVEQSFPVSAGRITPGIIEKDDKRRTGVTIRITGENGRRRKRLENTNAESPANFDLDSTILNGGNFSWMEATKCGTRIPEKPEIAGRIKETARYMEEVRANLGNRKITVLSWYRDPESNREAGGVKDSRHTYGDAVDFVVEGIAPSEVYEKLDDWHGNRGGLGKYPGFTHIDIRGHKARWSKN